MHSGQSIQPFNVVGRTYRVWLTSLPQLLIVAALVHVPRLGLRWLSRGAGETAASGEVGQTMTMVESLVVSAFVGSFAILFVVQRLKGDRPDLGRSIAFGFARIWTVLAIVLVIALPYLAVLLIPAPAASAVGSTQTARQHATLVLEFALAKQGAFAVVLLINLMFQVATPAAVVERRGVFAALARSRFLTHGNRVRILAAQLLLLLSLLPLVVPDVWISLRHANDFAAMASRSALELAAASIGCVLPSVLYHALREAKEGTGLDELAAAFE